MLTSDPRNQDRSGYDRLGELITARSGLQFPPSRRPQLEAAVEESVRKLGLRDADELWDRFRREPGRAQLEDFIASLTIGETYFFRHQPHFEALQNHVLPQLIETNRATKRLRVWSAGCSSGEEPYSLAIVLDQLLADLEDWDLMILGTDIDRAALTRGAEGIYRSWSLRRTPDRTRTRYFDRLDEHHWRLDPRVRRMVDLRYLNLVDDVYPSLFTNIHEMDLVLCRNVLIYFDRSTVRAVAAKMLPAIRDKGWLVVADAEISEAAFAGFVLRRFPGAFLYQKEQVVSEQRSDHPRSTPATAPVAQRSRERHPPAPPRDVRASRAVAAAVEERTEVDATKDLEAEAAEHPDDPRPPYLLAKRYADKVETEEAGRWIAEAVAREELFAPAHFLAGLVAEEQGHWDEAISALRRCIYADPQWPLPYLALGRNLAKLGRKSRAGVALTTAIQLLEEGPADEPIRDGDGLTAGRLLELARIQKEVSGIEPAEGRADGT